MELKLHPDARKMLDEINAKRKLGLSDKGKNPFSPPALRRAQVGLPPSEKLVDWRAAGKKHWGI